MATSAYQICLFADESCSSSDPIDIIIIAPVYTINITKSPIRIRFTITRIRKPSLLISLIVSLPPWNCIDTSRISSAPGIATTACVIFPPKSQKIPRVRRKSKSIFFIIKFLYSSFRQKEKG